MPASMLIQTAVQNLRRFSRSAPVQAAWERHASPFNCLMGLILFAAAGLDLFLAHTVHLEGVGEQTFECWPGLLLLVAVLGYCHWRPLPRLIDCCEMAIWVTLLTNVLTILIQFAGRSPFPLVDTQLTAIDHRLHFETASIVHAIASVPWLRAVLAIAYSSIPVMLFGAVMLPPFWGGRTTSRRYILGVTLAIILTAALFAIWPAAGPWTSQNLAPTPDQSAVTAYLLRLKSSGPVALDQLHAGIVSFPSFHVVLAILSAVALSSIRVLRLPASILAALTCISTITTGWHYGIDVLGGLAVTIVSLAAAKTIVTYLEAAPAAVPRPEWSRPAPVDVLVTANQANLS